MNKYLIEILKIQSSVILPGLGALMVPSQKSGKIVFNPHLKFNDGSLARFIAEKEGVDEQESQNKVAKFVREIEAEIGKGNSYDMYEFGKFYKNKDGEVDFEMYVPGEESTNSEPEKPKEEAKEKTKKPVVTPADIIKEEQKETASKKEEKSTEKTENKKKETKAKKKEPEAKEDKQAKNKFVPPVVEKAEEEVKEVVEKVEKKAEEVKKDVKEEVKKVEEKVKAAEEKATEAVKKVEEKVEKVVPTADKTKPEDKQSKNTFIPPKADEKKEEEKKSDTTRAGVAAAAATTLSAGIAAASAGGDSAKKTETTATRATNTKTVEKTIEKTKETVVKEEKKKRSKLPWLILLLLLIGLGIAGFFYKDEIMAYFDKGDTPAADSTATDNSDMASNENDHSTLTDESDADAVVDENTAMTDSSDMAIDSTDMDMDAEAMVDNESEIAEEPVVEDPPVEDTAPVVSGSNNGNYHLIGNSFGEESNAERYVQKMQEKGYPAKILGQFDGLYMVSLKSYDSRDAAKKGRSSVTADASSAWIFKYPK